jgi:septum formation protein
MRIMIKFVLASASPARRQLLQSAGIQPVVQQSDFDESQIQITDCYQLVQTLAQRKAEVVAAQLQEPALVLGCDSLLALEGEIYGKPKDTEEATSRWRQMRGRTGDLLTGHALVDLTQGKSLVRVQVTQVEFANLSDRQIAAYVATGEPLHCAGCFALDGQGGLFVERIIGCHSNVIGLSLPLLRQMLEQLGYDVTDFW